MEATIAYRSRGRQSMGGYLGRLDRPPWIVVYEWSLGSTLLDRPVVDKTLGGRVLWLLQAYRSCGQNTRGEALWSLQSYRPRGRNAKENVLWSLQVLENLGQHHMCNRIIESKNPRIYGKKSFSSLCEDWCAKPKTIHM